MASRPDNTTPSARVAVVGGGLAGLAAAVAARQRGLQVELFEARSRLGGRAGSFQDPESGEWVDHCQHVAMGCCTNLTDFCRRTGTADGFRRDRRLWFIGPDCRICAFSATPLLPSPLHLAPAMTRLRYLDLRDRLRIGRALLTLARENGEPDVSIGCWLREHGQSDRALEHFWSVVLVSALSETIDRASLSAARKVFLDGFLASRRAYEVHVPQASLGEIYDRRLGKWLVDHGVEVHLRTPVRRIDGSRAGATQLVLGDGSPRPFDFFVVALPWRTAPKVFAAELRQAVPVLKRAGQLAAAPITAVHLWYDRPIMSLPHAVLVGRMSQWIFNRSRSVAESAGNSVEHYYQVVISASGELKTRDRNAVVAQIREELADIWPAARSARLLRWRMVTSPEAVFSIRPGIDSIRPPQRTSVPNLMLAGDWTATGWPATMEGAVRSGYLAVETMLNSLGRPEPILVPDLPRGWLARRLFGR